MCHVESEPQRRGPGCPFDIVGWNETRNTSGGCVSKHMKVILVNSILDTRKLLDDFQFDNSFQMDSDGLLAPLR